MTMIQQTPGIVNDGMQPRYLPNVLCVIRSTSNETSKKSKDMTSVEWDILH